jgi:AcrR family transcriptional regulator
MPALAATDISFPGSTEAGGMPQLSAAACPETRSRERGTTRAMDTVPDTRDRILESAETLLRRFGPGKTTVSDIARALGMSHGNVYRHFASKADLQDAVMARWLKTVSDPLAIIAHGDGPAEQRLEQWALALSEDKRRRVQDDPELFETYHRLSSQARTVVDAHLAEMRRQLATIIRDGVVQGVFRVAEVEPAAAAVLHATQAFHHPYHMRMNAGRTDPEGLRRVLRLVLAGLKAGVL